MLHHGVLSQGTLNCVGNSDRQIANMKISVHVNHQFAAVLKLCFKNRVLGGVVDSTMSTEPLDFEFL
jgi:hypothetical protein